MKRIMIAFVSLMATSAFADIYSNNGYYVGGSVVQIDFSATTAPKASSDYTALEFVGGYKHNPFVGGEARVGVTSDLSYLSGYYRVESANDVSKAYLLAGYTFGTLSEGAYDDFSGFSFGGGVGFVVFEIVNLNLELRMLALDTKNDLELTSFNIGVDYRF